MLYETAKEKSTWPRRSGLQILCAWADLLTQDNCFSSLPVPETPGQECWAHYASGEEGMDRKKNKNISNPSSLYDKHATYCCIAEDLHI